MQALALRGFLAILTIFELTEIYSKLPTDLLGQGNDLSGFGSNLGSGDAEKRLWCFMLSLLVIARLTAFAAPQNPAAMGQCAAVHIVELIYMATEFLVYGCNGESFIFGFIIFDAILFAVLALRCGVNEGPVDQKKNK